MNDELYTYDNKIHLSETIHETLRKTLMIRSVYDCGY